MSAATPLGPKVDAAGVLPLLVRLILGGVMIYMSLAKLQEPGEFLKMIDTYGLVPRDWFMVMNLIAVLVPWIELLGGLALILGVALRGTGLVFAVLLVGFTAAITWRMGHFIQQGTPFFKVAFDCGCGAGPEIIWIKLIKNTALLLAASYMVLNRSRSFCLPALLKASTLRQTT